MEHRAKSYLSTTKLTHTVVMRDKEIRKTEIEEDGVAYMSAFTHKRYDLLVICLNYGEKGAPCRLQTARGEEATKFMLNSKTKDALTNRIQESLMNIFQQMIKSAIIDLRKEEEGAARKTCSDVISKRIGKTDDEICRISLEKCKCDAA